jgi:23S rRNA (uracil1939-C5)-methyltransferase
VIEPHDNKPQAPVTPERELLIEKWVYGGDGLGRLDGQVTLVPFVLPGERVRVEVERRRSSMLEARATEWLERAPERCDAPCAVFRRCGGCQYQHAPYEYQVARKLEILREVLRRVGHLEVPEPIGMLCAEPWAYRNRAQFRLAGGRIGFRAAGSHQLVPVEQCPISAPRINEALAVIARKLRDRRWPGFVTSLELFTNGEEVMVNVLETAGGQRVARGFFEWLAQSIPGAAVGWLDYEAAGARYRVSHGSFFQVNRFLIEGLAELALAGSEGVTALDLYAGVGLFTIPLARRFSTVAGVESSAGAVRNLIHNASTAGVTVNAHRMQAEQYLENLATTPDFVLADPPRSGLGKHAVHHLLRLAPPRITIVSCDPATLARDLAALLAGGYHVEEFTMVDLFPQTFHIESVVRLLKR